MPASTGKQIFPLLILFFMSLVSGLSCAQLSAGEEIILVRPSAWASALQTWKQYRETQGYEISEIDAELSQPELLNQIRSLAGSVPEPGGSPTFLLLVGDVDPRTEKSIPTFYRKSSAMVQFGGDERIGTDNPYGDLNEDEIPDLAVGRIPADTAEQAQAYLDKVIRYESNPDFSAWRRDVHIIAGVGGFGAIADSVIEMTTRRFLADRIPGWSELTMTQASTRSHYCPDPWRFSETCINRLNQGGMFWVYIGHGHVKTLDYVKADDQYLPIFTERNIPAIKSSAPPIAIFLACYTGAFDAVEDSLAERLTLKPDGPVASIAASRVSGPYGLATLSDGMLKYCYEDRVPTLGEIVLRSKQKMLADSASNGSDRQPKAMGQMQLITSIAKSLSPADYDLRAERLEHVWQMHLLGDPCLRIRYPNEVELQAPARAQPGEEIVVRGTSKSQAKMMVEFGFRRDQIRRELDRVQVGLDTTDGRNAFQSRYDAANDRILVLEQRQVPSGEFEQALTLPENLSNGRYCVRCYLEGKDDWQVGYHELVVRKPRPTKASPQ
ncbi:MAG: C25 family cysteine peptidase [Aureliella sp.]